MSDFACFILHIADSSLLHFDSEYCESAKNVRSRDKLAFSPVNNFCHGRKNVPFNFYRHDASAFLTTVVRYDNAAVYMLNDGLMYAFGISSRGMSIFHRLSQGLYYNNTYPTVLPMSTLDINLQVKIINLQINQNLLLAHDYRVLTQATFICHYVCTSTYRNI